MNRLTTHEEYPHGAEGKSVDRLAGCWCRGHFEATACIEKLSRYEDTGLEPEEILTGVQLAEIACMQIRYKKMQKLLEQAVEEIENCNGRETELSEAIRKELN